MIESREDLRRYLEQDRLALNRKNDRRPRLFKDEIWKFEILLRRVEYDINCRKGLALLLAGKYHPDDTEEGRRSVIDREGKNMCLLSLDIEHMTGKKAVELLGH